GRGIPAAVICTEPFVRMGRATAELAGLASYPFVLVPHPVGRLDPRELRVRVEATLPAVLELLLSPTRWEPAPLAWSAPADPLGPPAEKIVPAATVESSAEPATEKLVATTATESAPTPAP